MEVDPGISTSQCLDYHAGIFMQELVTDWWHHFMTVISDPPFEMESL
jgi:hypothetical protein